jgi:3-oxoacyl-[acyl-carrier protein] reductase
MVGITFVSRISESLADQVIATINNLGNGASAVKVQADMHNLKSDQAIVLL